MGRWEKWWQISHSSGFEKPTSAYGMEDILTLEVESEKLFPHLTVPRGSGYKWKKCVRRYGNFENENNVIIFIPLYRDAIKDALQIPLRSCFMAMMEKMEKNLPYQMPYLNFPLIDTSVKWAITLFCSRSLSTLMPVCDVMTTRTCYAVQGWSIPYWEGNLSLPFFKDSKTLRKAFREEVLAQEYLMDLSERICSCLKFDFISIFFKVNPAGEILDIRCRIGKEAGTKQHL